jgi:hypothetical protein
MRLRVGEAGKARRASRARKAEGEGRKAKGK